MTDAPATPPPPLRRVVLLGHTGFIGREVKRLFHDRPHGLDVVSDALPRIDLTRKDEAAALARCLDADTAVVMCAGIKRQLGESLEVFRRNLTMALNLARVLQERPIRRLVFLSSSAVYGEEVDSLNLREETPVRPVSYYGIAKLASELVLRMVMDAIPGATLAVLRPPLVYGWRDGGNIYGPSGFVRAALDGKPIVLWGDGAELREFVAVEDLAEVVYRLTLHDFDGVVNVVTGRSRTYQDAVAILENRLGRHLAVTSRPRSRRKVDNAYDNGLLRRLLPDFAFTSLEDGIARVLDGYALAERRAG
jgi:UDP-glucose 4-epimerase